MLIQKMAFLSIIFFLLSPYYNASAYNENQKLAADFLSYRDIIVAQEDPNKYNLESRITRREMAKVTIKLSDISFNIWCSEKYNDLQNTDWWCKYAEAGLVNGFFASNISFYPDKNISKIEALKMIMKWSNIEKENVSDWREWYVMSAMKWWIIKESFVDYDSPATRWWIFSIAQNSIQYSPDSEIQTLYELLNI